MVAADVDNDLFNGDKAIDKSDGDAIANLTYRVTALYTGRDSLLGLSAGLKHSGKRRLEERWGLELVYAPSGQRMGRGLLDADRRTPKASIRATSTRPRRSPSCGRC